MRFVQKDMEHRTERLASQQTYLELLEIIRTRNMKLINDAIYKEAYDTPDGRRSRVEDQLAKAYHYKCAYCERICKSDIEHYRPKKAVDEAGDHPGYYWLCYEWTNLLPACITCNREGSKHNHFPVLGKRVYAPVLLPGNQLALDTCKVYNSPLIEERPYLLHPEVDHPEDYFSFAVDPSGAGIRITGVDSEGRGERTIAICKLNRKELTLERVENVIDPFRTSVECLFVELLDQKITEASFIQGMLQLIRVLKIYSMREDKTHTFLRKYVVASTQNFEKIVLPYLVPRIRNIVFAAFKSEEN